MDCATVEELAGAYALDAVPDDEAQQVREHLLRCETHRVLIAELAAAADLLPLAVDDVEPPARLLERILAEANSGSQNGTVVARTAPRAGLDASLPAAARLSIVRPAQRFWQSPAQLGLAAAVLIAVALGGWSFHLQQQVNARNDALNRQQSALVAVAGGGRVAPLTGGGFQGEVVVSTDGHSAYLVATIPSTPAGKAYEAWMIRGGVPVPAGILTAGTAQVVQLQGTADGASAIAFTLENAAGSSKPTTPPVAKVALS